MSVVLGLGDAAGYFYHAASNTSIPSVTASVSTSTWTKVGLITADGVTFTNDYGAETIRDWANQVQRVISTESEQTVQCGIMDTTAEVFETLFGTSAVTTAGTPSVTTVKVPQSAPEPEAFLWRIKDGDTVMQIACKSGQIQEMDDITFAPGEATTWTPTIVGLGEGFEIQLA